MKKAVREHPFITIILFWLIYVSLFLLAEHVITEPVWTIRSVLDDYIPFTVWAIIPYAMWFPAILVTMLLMFFAAPRKEYYRLMLPMGFMMLTTLLFYFIVPNGVNVRVTDIPGNDLLSHLVRFLHSSDTPMNTCPSIHVIVMVMIDLAWQKSSLLEAEGRQWIRSCIRILDIMVCASTVLLKQHSIVDVFWALVYVLIVEKIAERRFNAALIDYEDLPVYLKGRRLAKALAGA